MVIGNINFIIMGMVIFYVIWVFYDGKVFYFVKELIRVLKWIILSLEVGDFCD